MEILLIILMRPWSTAFGDSRSYLGHFSFNILCEKEIVVPIGLLLWDSCPSHLQTLILADALGVVRLRPYFCLFTCPPYKKKWSGGNLIDVADTVTGLIFCFKKIKFNFTFGFSIFWSNFLVSQQVWLSLFSFFFPYKKVRQVMCKCIHFLWSNVTFVEWCLYPSMICYGNFVQHLCREATLSYRLCLCFILSLQFFFCLD